MDTDKDKSEDKDAGSDTGATDADKDKNEDTNASASIGADTMDIDKNKDNCSSSGDTAAGRIGRNIEK